jgi:hypothetical protein
MNINIILGLEVLFGPGAEWPTPHISDFIILTLIILALIGIYISSRYYYYLKSKRENAHTQFLYKSKQLGLTNYQFKILNLMVDASALKDPNEMLEDPILFESSIKKYEDIEKTDLQVESIRTICRDIVISYEKLYHPATYKKPLNTLSEIENNILICLFNEEGDVFIGKIMSKNQGRMTIRLIRTPETVRSLIKKKISVYLFRAGDAEYNFDAIILDYIDKTIDIAIPEKYSRGMAVRLPYVDVIIPCTITKEIKPVKEKDTKGKESKKETVSEEDNILSGSIFKINENEALIRLARIIDYNIDYYLDFVISDFNIKIKSNVISELTIHENNIQYCTFKFNTISDAAKNVLKNFIMERL